MIQAVLLFLIFLLALGLVGKWRRPRVPPKASGPAIQSARKCATCDAYLVGAVKAACGRADCPQR